MKKVGNWVVRSPASQLGESFKFKQCPHLHMTFAVDGILNTNHRDLHIYRLLLPK